MKCGNSSRHQGRTSHSIPIDARLRYGRQPGDVALTRKCFRWKWRLRLAEYLSHELQSECDDSLRVRTRCEFNDVFAFRERQPVRELSDVAYPPEFHPFVFRAMGAQIKEKMMWRERIDLRAGAFQPARILP